MGDSMSNGLLTHLRSLLTLVVDLAVTIHIRFADHLIDLGIGKLLACKGYGQSQRLSRTAAARIRTEVGHDVPELSSADVAIAVLIEDLECLLDLLFTIGVAHLARHHGEELREVDRAVAVSVDLVDHVLELSLCRVLAQRAHDGTELLGGDRAIAVCTHVVSVLRAR